MFGWWQVSQGTTLSEVERTLQYTPYDVLFAQNGTAAKGQASVQTEPDWQQQPGASKGLRSRGAAFHPPAAPR